MDDHTIRELEQKISELKANVVALTRDLAINEDELKKHKQAEAKYKFFKGKYTKAKRDKKILVVISVLLFAMFCWQAYAAYNDKIERQRLENIYKRKNPPKPIPGAIPNEVIEYYEGPDDEAAEE